MFKNYLKVIVRNFRKNKAFSFINITGLAIGLTSCLLIALYIQQQLSFDDFETKGSRIARVIMQYSFAGSDAANKGNFTSVRVAKVFRERFPEVENAVKMQQTERIVVNNDKLFSEKNFMYADASFFDVFSFRLLQGNPHQALAGLNDLVVTESTAKKYFGSENAIGKTLRLSGDSNLYRITGIAQDCPANSQIQFDLLASFSSLHISPDNEQSYWDANYTTYLLLHDKNSIGKLQAKLPAFMKTEMAGEGAKINFFLEPFTTIHLYSDYDAFTPNVSIAYIYILAAVALLILIIAGFTYVNLSTARSVERAKEVGVRKVIGAGKNQIFWQFIGESILLCLVAVVVAFIAAALLLPSFNALTSQPLSAGSLFSLSLIGIAGFIVIIISFAAGSYPALILSSFQPVKVLKGAFKNAGSGQFVRRSLIVFQFAISVFLIVATFIIQQQLYFIQHKKLGYDRSHVLVVPVGYHFTNTVLLKNEFKQNADVLNVSRSHSTPVDIHGGYSMRSSVMPENTQIAITANPVDEEFVPAAGLQLVSGANITLQDMKDAADSNTSKTFHFILNESAAKQLGWSPQEAIGKKMFVDNSRPGFVKGVVKDFNFQSMHEAIKPLVLFPGEGEGNLVIKLSSHNLPQTLAFLESKWKALLPDRPFEYRFMDDDFNRMYDSEMRLGKIMNVFSSIAIILACLGLFGLSSYSVQQRVKEIGIRKVLGASVSSIMIALSKDFVKLALIAICIASPVAWWLMQHWLQSFSYRISITWMVFAMAALATLLLTVVTISFQSIKAALANPVKSLRTE